MQTQMEPDKINKKVLFYSKLNKN